MAAVLASGPLALASHRSAAHHWDLIRSSATLPDVTVPHGARRHQGIRLHRSRTLTDEDRDVVNAIPVTSVARTLLDLAAVAPRQIDQALERAERLGSFDLVAIDSLLERCGRHRGAPKLRRALGLYVPGLQTRSELERRFLALLESAGLPRPSVNVFAAGHEVDMLWPAQRLVVELDGYEYHRTRAAFERDRRRDEDLKVAGYEVIRLTARRLAEEPALAISRVGALLGRQAARVE